MCCKRPRCARVQKWCRALREGEGGRWDEGEVEVKLKDTVQLYRAQARMMHWAGESARVPH